MLYALHHMFPIIIAALGMAAVAIATMVFADRSHKLNEEHGYDPAWDKSDLMCAGCKFFSVCGSDMAKMKAKDEAEFAAHHDQEIKAGRVIPFTPATAAAGAAPSAANDLQASAESDAQAAIRRYTELKNGK